MLGSLPLLSIYFYVIVGCAVLAIFLFFFGDIFSFDGPIDPILVVPLAAFTSLFGYLCEKLTDWNSILIFVGSFIGSTAIIFLVNFYVLIPLRNADATISISEKDMEGQVATVTIPIPEKGMGEIRFVSVTGSQNRPAVFYQPQLSELPTGSKVLIIEIKDRVCYVLPYTENFSL